MKNESIEEIKRKIIDSDAIIKFKIDKLAIFGSYALGTQTKNSDIDILVEFNSPITLISFIKLKNELATLLKSNIDLVTKNALKPNIGKSILNSAIYIL